MNCSRDWITWGTLMFCTLYQNLPPLLYWMKCGGSDNIITFYGYAANWSIIMDFVTHAAYFILWYELYRIIRDLWRGGKYSGNNLLPDGWCCTTFCGCRTWDGYMVCNKLQEVHAMVLIQAICHWWWGLATWLAHKSVDVQNCYSFRESTALAYNYTQFVIGLYTLISICIFGYLPFNKYYTKLYMAFFFSVIIAAVAVAILYACGIVETYVFGRYAVALPFMATRVYFFVILAIHNYYLETYYKLLEKDKPMFLMQEIFKMCNN